MSCHIYISIQHILSSFQSAFTVFYQWSPNIRKSSSVSGGHFWSNLETCPTFAHLSTASCVYWNVGVSRHAEIIYVICKRTSTIPGNIHDNTRLNWAIHYFKNIAPNRWHVFSKFYYQLMHKRIALNGVLKFTLK
jgi:hypothetical protein